MSLPNNPQTRKEMYLSNMAGQGTALPSEPHTREEEYLDYIAKNGGGGGTGEGDMTKAVYDDDLAVAAAGGIADYVAGAITGKADQTDVDAILNGTNIDSFGDVETALARKMPNFNINHGLMVWTDAQTGIESLQVDYTSSVTQSSEKPITSGGVYTALQNKVDKVTGKGLSTNDYDNTAKGIVDNIQSNVIANTKLIKDTVGWSGKNKLPNVITTQTVNGVTATKNADNSVTVNGTATADAWIKVADNIKLSNGSYILTGCSTGGADNKYRLGFYVRNAADTADEVGYSDYGSGVSFTLNYSPMRRMMAFIFVKNGQTVSNLTFKPMIRDDDILDDTYEPYFGSTAFPRSEQAVLGAENLFDKTKCVGIDATVTQTANGFRGQVNNHTWGSVRQDFATPAKNTLFTVSCHANVATAGNFMKLQVYGSTDGSDYSNSLAVTDIYTSSKDLLLTFNSGNYNYLRFTFYLTNGTATSADVTFENPMFNIGSVALDYVSYAMTNKELTDAVQDIGTSNDTVITGTISVPNNTATEIASLTLTKGKYLLSGIYCANAASQDYDVMLNISNTTTPTSGREEIITGKATTFAQVGIQIVRYVEITTERTYKLFVKHNAGEAVTVYPAFRAIRIG